MSRQAARQRRGFGLVTVAVGGLGQVPVVAGGDRRGDVVGEPVPACGLGGGDLPVGLADARAELVASVDVHELHQVDRSRHVAGEWQPRLANVDADPLDERGGRLLRERQECIDDLLTARLCVIEAEARYSASPKPSTS